MPTLIIFTYRREAVISGFRLTAAAIAAPNIKFLLNKEGNHMRVGFIGLGIMGKPMAKNPFPLKRDDCVSRILCRLIAKGDKCP